MSRQRPRNAGDPRRNAGKPRRNAVSPRHSALHGLVALERGKVDRLREAVDLSGLTPRDRDFAYELAQGTERLHLMLDFVLAQFVTKRLPKNATVRTALRLGAYQLLMMSRVPARAAVHETVALLTENRSFANAVLRRVAERVYARAADESLARRELPLPDGPDGPRCFAFDADALPPPGSHEYLAVRFGIPEFLTERFVAAYGFDAARSACAASAATPSVYLRPTYRVPDGESLATILSSEGVETEASGLLFRVVRGAAFGTRAFRDGQFVAQDPTAYAAACALDVEPDDVVADVCAAPGTKTMVFAEIVRAGTGAVHAFDKDRVRLGLVKENAARLGLTEQVRYPDELASVDRAMVDVPCSNTGVLARRIEVRRRVSEAAIRDLCVVQKRCLEAALAATRPGGTVVYSTCSIEPEENRGVVDTVVPDHAELIRDHTTLPGPAGDGGYFAVLRAKAAS